MKRLIRPTAGFKNSSAKLCSTKGDRIQTQAMMIEMLSSAEGRLAISRNINISAVFEKKRQFRPSFIYTLF
jgi:hypothetical protein